MRHHLRSVMSPRQINTLSPASSLEMGGCYFAYEGSTRTPGCTPSLSPGGGNDQNQLGLGLSFASFGEQLAQLSDGTDKTSINCSSTAAAAKPNKRPSLRISDMPPAIIFPSFSSSLSLALDRDSSTSSSASSLGTVRDGGALNFRKLNAGGTPGWREMGWQVMKDDEENDGGHTEGEQDGGKGWTLNRVPTPFPTAEALEQERGEWLEGEWGGQGQ